MVRQLWTPLSLVFLLALAVACSEQPVESDTTPSRSELQFTVQLAETPEGELAVDLGLVNLGAPIPATDAFNGYWQLVSQGEVRASGTVFQLQRLTKGETPLIHWEGEVEPGSYELIWGASGFGHTRVRFEMLPGAAGNPVIGEQRMIMTSADPSPELSGNAP